MFKKFIVWAASLSFALPAFALPPMLPAFALVTVTAVGVIWNEKRISYNKGVAAEVVLCNTAMDEAVTKQKALDKVRAQITTNHIAEMEKAHAAEKDAWDADKKTLTDALSTTKRKPAWDAKVVKVLRK